jgi:hypothetical protein
LQLSRHYATARKQVARRYANTAEILEFEAPGGRAGDVSIKQRRHHDITNANTRVVTLIENDNRGRGMGR